MILPLFGGLTEIEVLARIAGEPESDPYKLVYADDLPGLAGTGPYRPRSIFRCFLHDGLLADSGLPGGFAGFQQQRAAARLLGRGVARR